MYSTSQRFRILACTMLFACVSAPFTFTGRVLQYASFAAMQAGADPIATYDLFGHGTAEADLYVQTTGDGTPLPALPLVAFSVRNHFESVDHTGTVVAGASRNRRGRSRWSRAAAPWRNVLSIASRHGAFSRRNSPTARGYST